jgi:hypothetical protein
MNLVSPGPPSWRYATGREFKLVTSGWEGVYGSTLITTRRRKTTVEPVTPSGPGALHSWRLRV